jgi:hypothetical protein
LSVQRVAGQSVTVRPVSLPGVLLIGLLAVVIVVAVIAFAIVAIPLLIVSGLAYTGYRALTGAAARKRNELLNRDDLGRQNVRVLRSTPPAGQDVADQSSQS